MDNLTSQDLLSLGCIIDHWMYYTMMMTQKTPIKNRVTRTHPHSQPVHDADGDADGNLAFCAAAVAFDLAMASSVGPPRLVEGGWCLSSSLIIPCICCRSVESSSSALCSCV